MKHLIFILLPFILISCKNEKHDIERLERFIEYKIEDYELIRYKSWFDMGGSFVVIEIKLDNEDMEFLLNKIKASDKYTADENGIYYYDYSTEKTREAVFINPIIQTITYSNKN